MRHYLTGMRRNQLRTSNNDAEGELMHQEVELQASDLWQQHRFNGEMRKIGLGGVNPIRAITQNNKCRSPR